MELPVRNGRSNGCRFDAFSKKTTWPYTRINRGPPLLVRRSAGRSVRVSCLVSCLLCFCPPGLPCSSAGGCLTVTGRYGHVGGWRRALLAGRAPRGGDQARHGQLRLPPVQDQVGPLPMGQRRRGGLCRPARGAAGECMEYRLRPCDAYWCDVICIRQFLVLTSVSHVVSPSLFHGPLDLC